METDEICPRVADTKEGGTWSPAVAEHIDDGVDQPCPSVLWGALGCFGVLWGALGCFGVLWGALGCFGVLRVAPWRGALDEAMKSATGVAVRNCPSSSCRRLGFSMAAIFMSSSYQAEFRFASEQTGIVRRIKRVVFRGGSEAGLKGGRMRVELESGRVGLSRSVSMGLRRSIVWLMASGPF